MTPDGRRDSDASLLRRIVTDYSEMPGLSVTVPQAVRLWGLDTDRCRTLLDVLVAGGVLRRTPRGQYVDARNGG